ncbi:long-chain fatty acid--CoA ligase [Amycolatopsis sp. A133]|uniref:class I adenylate-forming enzyme family protein n=1 Tax=Amycolatopsis sp. A133 TaxID=3064472 RepID=UPI0027FFCF6E|nr:long-chain fatty acid--CoA ligase [Amycolatopsis sp. A133]MDQ7803474.1 long-chain fatty acid--CoA ligase [Amycolatopsis sp. A133]
MISSADLADRLCGPVSDGSVWLDETGGVDRRALHDEVGRLTRLLAGHGAGAGDCVALQLEPCATLAALLPAIWRLGARVMLLDHRLTEAETARLTGLWRPAFVVRAGTRPASFTARCDVVVERLDDPAEVPAPVCLVQFTSGSTGQAKVVARSAASLDAELDRYAAIEDMPTPADRLLLLCSPVHTWGLVGGVLYGLAHQVPLVFPVAQHGGAIARTAQRLGATAIFGVPTHFELMGALAEPPPLAGLRIATSAGMTTDQRVADRFRDATGCRLGQVYGLTEAGVVTADLAGRYEPPSVGRPAPGVDVRVTDGELYIRLGSSPYLVADGVARFADGWLRTFDRAELDPETGAVRVLGRADSVVAVGGVKIDLMEIEQALREHPGVAGAVVTFGEVIEAHVAAVRGLTDAELMRWCRERLSPLKTPKRYFLREKLPETPNGKVVRGREQLLSAFGEQA